MKELLISILEKTDLEVFLEGSISPETYPDEFITVWQFDSSNRSYSNSDVVTEWAYNVRLFSKSPTRMEELKKLILSYLKENKFIPDGKGYDFSYDINTHHMGWSVDVYILEVNK